MPSSYYAKDLAQALCQTMQKGQRVLLPRARIGSKDLTDILTQNGIEFTDVALYDTLYQSHNTHAVEKLIDDGQVSCAVFTSASTVRGFAATMQGKDLSLLTAACIGEKTAQAAKEYNMKVMIAKEATIDSVTQMLVEHADELRLNR